MLQSRQVDSSSSDYPSHIPHIFAYNRDVDQHNQCRLNATQEQVYNFNSIDSKTDDQTGTINTANLKGNAAGLPSTISLSVNARVMFMKNVNVQDGLVNSATGIVTGFIPSPSASDTADTFNPKYILIDFDDSRVGKQTRSQSRGIIPHDLNTSTPICRLNLK